MVETLSAQARLLELFFEVLGAERGRSKARIRRMDAYRGLGERAFESQFQRDKDALRQIGVDLLPRRRAPQPRPSRPGRPRPAGVVAR